MQTTKQGSKNGGPYTKKQQEERRKQVYHLYFEKSYPIVKIANVVNINRNTISEDVKYWYSQFADEWEYQDLSSWMETHIQRLEVQKMRLLEEAEKTDQIQIRLGIEKLLFTIENKLGQLGLELFKNKKPHFVPEDPEKEIKEIVKHLISIKKKQDCLFAHDEIEYEILKFKKCDESEAEDHFYKMNELGLGYCSINTEDDKVEIFDLKKFAEIRGYLV